MDCAGDIDLSVLTVAKCCISTSRRTYSVSGSEICEECQCECYTELLYSCNNIIQSCVCHSPAVTFQCYVQNWCGSNSETITSFLTNGESVCCNGNYSAWRAADGNPTCNFCPVPGRYSHCFELRLVTSIILLLFKHTA